MITLKQLKTGAVGRSSGMDTEGCDFLRYCNDSVRQLMNRGNWWTTVNPVIGCVRDNVITWPRGVATILGYNECGRQTLLANRWYQFMQPDSRHRQWANDYARRGFCGQPLTESTSTSPVFNPIKAEGFTIRTYTTKASDSGKKVTWYGIGVGGQVIRTTRSDGTVQDGVEVTLTNTFVDTPMAVRHVSRFVKTETDGEILAYQHNVAQDFDLDLGRYQPTEICPEYITTQVRGHSWGGRSFGNGCGCQRQVEALVKLNFVPFKFDDDLVQIDTEDAIRDMLLAIRKKEQGDISGSFAYETSAIRELNYQMRNRFPDEQFIVNFRPFGRDDLNNYDVRIGQI